jgi:hypothetical protein
MSEPFKRTMLRYSRGLLFMFLCLYVEFYLNLVMLGIVA